MSTEDDILEELEIQASTLRKTRNEILITLNKRKDERDRLNVSVRELREEAKKHRDQRDEINEKVKKIKLTLSSLFEILDKKLGKIHQVDEALQAERSNKPKKSKIEDDLKRIEWEVMTTPTVELREKEDELISRASGLRKTLDELNALEKQEDKKMDILADAKVTEFEIRELRNQINNLSNQSQEHHGKMILLFEQADKEREKANEVHYLYVENLKKMNVINKKLDIIMPQIKGLRKGIIIKDQKAQEDKKDVLHAKLEVQRQVAMRKLEKGEKLGFEELRLIYGDKEE